ncbi:MAG TPA: YebC/PmpR family DNA-binding transcriptional regulator [Dehalococcoidia bacterium]|nr:YebC/PmpR family DNA-binding transcriptional regulator [Dehalococcoidia bacterium]
MAGHSKWAQIKRQKAVVDARRGQLFGKLARDIAVAARQGGSGDPALNFRLRLAVQKAREANMPNDNIERAIKRGVGEGGASELQEVAYEGYGPGGVAILVQALTDNRNRTVADVRTAFSRHGGNLGEAGCVAWQFSQKGQVTVPPGAGDPDEIGLLAIDLGAEDFKVDTDGSMEIITAPENLESVRDGFAAAGIHIDDADLVMHPSQTIRIDARDADTLLRLFDRLDELDDVQRVYSNADIPEEVLAAAGV